MTQSVNASRVLVVDDEATIREMVGINLRREGLEVVFAENGPDAIEAVQLHDPAVMVLDILMPGMDGLEVCRRVRDVSTLPILLLSARGEEIDRIVGLEMGADDFLTKPFAMRELVARVRAMIRRVRMTTPVQGLESPTPVAPPSRNNAEIVHAGAIEVDALRRRATAGGNDLNLKPKEFELLLYFARHQGIVLHRDALLRDVWGYDYPIDTRTVDVHVRWLRQKLEAELGQPSHIETLRGLGYRFVIRDV